MEVTVTQLIDKYSWEEIEPVVLSLYPTRQRPIVEYGEAYQKFSTITPTETKMRIFIEKKDATTGEIWYDFFGKDGTLVKDSFPLPIKKDLADENLQAIWENEQRYAISYSAWAEIAGMTIDPTTISCFSEKEIVAHVLVEIAAWWYTDEQYLPVLEEIKAITEGQIQNLVHKEAVSSKGIRRVWFENKNGLPHGFSTTYWEDGKTIQYQGIRINGNTEGVWTFWDKSGKIEKQLLCMCDREMEWKTEAPWWDDAKNQE